MQKIWTSTSSFQLQTFWAFYGFFCCHHEIYCDGFTTCHQLPAYITYCHLLLWQLTSIFCCVYGPQISSELRWKDPLFIACHGIFCGTILLHKETVSLYFICETSICGHSLTFQAVLMLMRVAKCEYLLDTSSSVTERLSPPSSVLKNEITIPEYIDNSKIHWSFQSFLLHSCLLNIREFSNFIFFRLDMKYKWPQCIHCITGWL